MIHLSHNHIVNIDQGAFIKLNILTFIDLSNNLIKMIGFENNTKLKMVMLNGNSLFSFTYNFLRLAKNGATVYLSWVDIGFHEQASLVSQHSSFLFAKYKLIKHS